ncbi:T9SS type A sorting domain-containing protein [Pseudotamlana agarivorans]|uniref:T9SS type A sorting domain-containing protein n=1 Tax=Pseudotamlana agarivorans TaxID=481183 RepID=UPI00082B8CF5|nr:M64 family metallopeptidase [Tamlana agarivorans]
MKKQLILVISILLTIGRLTAQTFPIAVIKNSGDDDKKINIVILSEGYQAGELDKFISDATTFTNRIFNTSPFKEYSSYFNVYALKIPSNESGADHPGTATDYTEPLHPVKYVDTYFNSTFDSFGKHYLLYYEIDSASANDTETKIINVLADNFPNYDQGLILVNTAHYGGSGGDFPVSYSGYWGAAVAMHEMGHSLFKLFDEYYPGDDLAGEGINMTQETDPTKIRWKNWYNANQAGIHQHHYKGTPKDWYKPNSGTCIMESVDKPFCHVCKEGIVEKIHELTSPINAYTPNESTVEVESFPLEFALDLTKPNPNTLQSTWTLNLNDIASNVDVVSISEADLLKGTNTLTTVITDDTSLLKVDNHETIHAYTVTWTLNYDTLGLTDIESGTQKFSLSFYPNPVSDYLNISYENNNQQPLRLELVGMDGKLIKSMNLSPLTDQKIDLSFLSTGVYLVRFYSGPVLISSKQLIKQ